uniref:Uncharacterized protein n=1 Tax=Bracon brevicornis TaxID=1563983 RepID=A0A6V7KE50_9HYME
MIQQKRTLVDTRNEKGGIRREWGVKLSDGSIDNKLPEENMPNYVLRQKWGVNFYEPIIERNNDEEKNYENKIVSQQIPSRQIKSSDLTSMLESQFMDSMEKKKYKRVEAQSVNPPPIIDSTSTVVPPIGEEVDPLKPINGEPESIITSERKQSVIAKELLNTPYFINTDEDNNHAGSGESTKDDEISAWQGVMLRTKKRMEEIAEIEKAGKSKEERSDVKFTIIPEPPSPKLDIAVMKPLESKIQEYLNPNDITSMFDVKNIVHQVDSKKFHTLSLFFLCLPVGSSDDNDNDEYSPQYLPLEISDVPTDNSHDIVQDDEIQVSAPKSNIVKPQKDNQFVDDGVRDNYIRIPGDPYPFNKKSIENLKLFGGDASHEETSIRSN